MSSSIEDYCRNFKVEISPNRKEVFFDGCIERLRCLEYSWRTNLFWNFACPTQCFKKGISAILSFVVNSTETASMEYSARAVELPFQAFNTCFKCIHLLKRILLLAWNLECWDYFPWDASALSLSIFVFRFNRFLYLPSTAMHSVFVHSVPCSDEFPRISRLELATPFSSRKAAKGSDISVQKFTEKDRTKTTRLLDSDFASTPTQEETYKQICTCCSRLASVSHRKWCHTELQPFIWFKNSRGPFQPTMFLILILALIVLPTADCAFPTNTTQFSFSTSLTTSFTGKLFCDGYDLENLLSKSQMLDCSAKHGSDKSYCSAIETILKKDRLAHKAFQGFLDTVKKYTTSETYSVQWSMDCCKAAYKNWICSYFHPRYDKETGQMVSDDADYCKCVEISCPFFRVFRNTKLYGGQPTFLCQGFQENYAPPSKACFNVSESKCGPLHRYSNFPDHEMSEFQVVLKSQTTKRRTDSAPPYSAAATAASRGRTVPRATTTSSGSRICCTLVWIITFTTFHCLSQRR